MKQPIELLKEYFETGDKPTEQQFSDLIDSFYHKDTGTVIQNVKVDESTGKTNISLSDGSNFLVPNEIQQSNEQNNKVRVVNLGTVYYSFINLEGGQEIVNSIKNQAVVNAINNLTPPLNVAEDELIVFQCDLQEEFGDFQIEYFS